MEFLLALLVLLVVARVFGEVAERMRIPSMVGELLAGIALGPALLGWLAPSAGLQILADLGIFFLVYLAGMELTIADVKRSLRDSGIVVAVFSFIAPFALGVVVASAFEYALPTALFIGVALALTALPVSVRVLTYLDRLDTEWGRTIVTAGLVCDVGGLAVVGLLSSWIREGYVLDLPTVALLGVKLSLFGCAIAATGKLLHLRQSTLARWLVRHSERFLSKGASFALPFAAALAYAFLADALGLHYVLGVFFGTLLLAEHLVREDEAQRVHDATSMVSAGLLSPVFFAFIGLSFATASLTNWPLIAAVLAAAFVGKIVGGYAGAALARFPPLERLAIGLGMNGRGAMELVIATIGLELGILDVATFSILVLVGVVTTIAMPVTLKRVVAREVAAVPAPEAAPSPLPREAPPKPT